MVLLFCKIRRPWAPPLFKVTRLYVLEVSVCKLQECMTWHARLQECMNPLPARLHEWYVHNTSACKLQECMIHLSQVTGVHDPSFWKLHECMVHLSATYKSTIYICLQVRSICKVTRWGNDSYVCNLQEYMIYFPARLHEEITNISTELQEYRIHLSAW